MPNLLEIHNVFGDLLSGVLQRVVTPRKAIFARMSDGSAQFPLACYYIRGIAHDHSLP